VPDSRLLPLIALPALLVGLVALVVLALVALDARPLPEGERPRFDNLLDVICVNGGFDRPNVHLVETAARNSAMLRSDETHLVVTDGLIDAVDYMSLEALLAHQLGAGDQPDLEYRTRAVGLLSLLPDGLQERLADRLLDQGEVFGADVHGAQITRYPPGLVVLLEVVAEGDNRVGGVTPAGSDLWLVNPLGAHAEDPAHPPLEDRIALLREL
jgi:Zn-dependent protease with chaperone function